MYFYILGLYIILQIDYYELMIFFGMLPASRTRPINVKIGFASQGATSTLLCSPFPPDYTTICGIILLYSDYAKCAP